MKNDVLIRAALPQDATQCSEVFCASIRTLCSEDHGDDEALIESWIANKTPESILGWIEKGEPQLFVAEIQHEIVAVGGITLPNEVSLNYVSPEHTGRGVSRALLEALENELKQSGAVIGTLTSTKTARQFYEACGWHVAGEIQPCMSVEGYPMEKTF